MDIGIDIFTAAKYECTFSTSDNVDAPVAVRKEYSVINIEDDGFVTLMDDSGELKEDLKLPEDEWLKPIVERIRAIFSSGSNECLVSVLAALGTEKILDCKEGKAI